MITFALLSAFSLSPVSPLQPGVDSAPADTVASVDLARPGNCSMDVPTVAPVLVMPGEARIVGTGDPTWLELSAEGRLVQLSSIEPQVEGYVLSARRGGLEQVLVRAEGDVPELVSAGDFDGDDLLDLRIDGAEGPSLWLSGAAAEGELVGRVVELGLAC